ASVRIKKRFNSEMIAGAEKTLPAIIPNCKCEVAKQVFDAIIAPPFVSMEDEFCVIQRLVLAIDAGVGIDLQGHRSSRISYGLRDLDRPVSLPAREDPGAGLENPHRTRGAVARTRHQLIPNS